MTTTPVYAIQAFSVPKYGHTEAENEDAVAFDTVSGWFTVADGATEASYSREWAQLLAKAFAPSTFGTDRFVDRLLDRLPSTLVPVSLLDRLVDRLFVLPGKRYRLILQDVQKRWHDGVPWDRLASRGWLFVEKARQGAFATFLIVKITGSRWSAIGVGDCNLFIVSDTGKVRLSIPAQNAAAFGTSPSLLPSIPGPAVERALKASWRKTGKWNRGERFVICTDAVAAYLLRADQEGEGVWDTLLTARTSEEFTAWVERARESGMRNDDSTVAIVALMDGLA